MITTAEYILMNQVTHNKPELYNSFGGAHCLRETVLDTGFQEFCSWSEILDTITEKMGEEYVTASFKNRHFVPNTSFFANLKLNKQLFAFYTIDTNNEVIKMLRVGELLQNFSGASFNAPLTASVPLKAFGLADMIPIMQSLVWFTPHKKGVRGVRNGAVAVTIDIDSPGAIESIICLKGIETLVGMPEVKLNSSFFDKVRNDEHMLIETEGQNPFSIAARKILEIISEIISKHSRPGLIFEIEEDHIIAPCGEITCVKDEGIPEASLNLTKFIVNSEFDYSLLRQSFYDAVSFLNRVIDINPYITEEQRSVCLSRRSIGVGLMGLADLCCMLKIDFPSKEALDLLGNILDKLKEYSNEAEILKFNNVKIFAFSPTGTRSAVGKCSPTLFSYFDKLTTSCLTQTEKDNLIKSGNVKVDSDWSFTDFVEIVKLVEDKLDARVSYNVTLTSPTTKEIYDYIIKAHSYGVKQISFFADYGQTSNVAKTLMMPDQDI